MDNKVFDASGTILQSCRSSTLEVDVTVLSSYPSVSVGGTNATLAQAADGGHYEGTVSVTLAGAGAITVQSTTPDGGAGSKDTFALALDAPPVLTSLSFTGGYPGGQTELKEGDTFQITGTTDKDADAVFVQDSGAGVGETLVFAAGTTFTVTMTIARRGTTPQALAATVQARDAVTGALGAARATNQGGGAVDGTDVVTLNDLHPTVYGFTKTGAGAPTTDAGRALTVAYPGGQQALKGVETADITGTASDFDTIVYDDAGTGELSPANPTTLESPKTVTRAGGTYNIATDNYRIVATRIANGSSITVSGVVRIANVAPTISISLPAARLRSGGNNGTSAQDHAVTITSDQQLLSAPSLSPDSGGNRGTFQGAGFTGGPTVWTRDLRVDEGVPDEKGTFNFEGLVATGLAGVQQNVIGSGAAYTLGGFVARSLTFAAFQTTAGLGTSVEDFTKLTAGIFTATNQPALKQAIGTSPPVTNGYTIDATGANPTSVIWLDTAAAGSNSGGTAQITAVEETV